jgi:RecJ-like exonuclease
MWTGVSAIDFSHMFESQVNPLSTPPNLIPGVGGGHLVVGSIKFVEGMRTEVIQRLAEMIGALVTDK